MEQLATARRRRLTEIVVEAGALDGYRSFVNAFGGFLWEYRLSDFQGSWRVGGEVTPLVFRWGAGAAARICTSACGDGVPRGTALFFGVPFTVDRRLGDTEVVWEATSSDFHFTFHATIVWPIDA